MKKKLRLEKGLGPIQKKKEKLKKRGLTHAGLGGAGNSLHGKPAFDRPIKKGQESAAAQTQVRGVP